ncbi:MAG: long-chain fatty acid--CoA ligase [Planctomycetaceae bacterium]
MALNLASILHNSTRTFPRETAIIADNVRYTYERLDQAARRFAAELLERGLNRGEKVAIMIPNVPEFSIAYFGVLYAGGVVVPLSTLHVATELVYQIDDCEARAFVVHADCAAQGVEAYRRAKNCPHLYMIGSCSLPSDLPSEVRSFADVMAGGTHADLAQTNSDETAVILYTSGTTGKPKGAELTHFNVYTNSQYNSERTFSLWPDEINVMKPGHVAIACLPLYHTFGQTNVHNTTLFGGAAVTLVKRFTAEAVVHVIQRDRVTHFAGVPTMYLTILNDPATKSADLSCLKFCVSGGAPMPVEAKHEFQKRFKVRIQEGYGLTETSPLACQQRYNETEAAGTIGKPINGVEMKIFDENDQEVPVGERGEVVIRGNNIMKGYFKQPEATAAAMRNGWFHSGDIGYVNDKGEFHIVDRKKDMILRGGYNVYPREVEEALYAHPCVAEAAVIGIPDDRLGEEVKAVISLKAGSQATVEEIIEHCKKLVATYKYPRHVEIIESLPKGPTGKILKRALRG